MDVGVAVGLGGVIGMLLGLLGGGGSILAVPALVYVLGLSLTTAIPMSLLVVGAASATGAIPKIQARHIDWRMAGVFAAMGVPATFIGAAVGDRLPDTAVMIGFAVVMIAAGLRMLRDTCQAGTACAVGESAGIDWRRCAPRAIPTSFGVGLLTGLFGVGGGFLIVPALVLLLGIEMEIAVGTSLFVIVANSAAGLLAHAGGFDAISWAITAAFAGAAIVAALIAAKLGAHMTTDRLQHWFAYLVFAVAAYVLADTLLR